MSNASRFVQGNQYGRRPTIPEKIILDYIAKLGYKKGKVKRFGMQYGRGLYRPIKNTGDYYANCIWGPFSDFGRKIGPYEMDVCFPDSKLDVEIDGIHHTQPDRIEFDKVRDHLLRSIDWYVVRMPTPIIYDAFQKELRRRIV